MVTVIIAIIIIIVTAIIIIPIPEHNNCSDNVPVVERVACRLRAQVAGAAVAGDAMMMKMMMMTMMMRRMLIMIGDAYDIQYKSSGGWSCCCRCHL